tara:strand:- start:503 stop:1768 length:1266 start_codon:yes stop_codon:yes gene_type:complete
MITTIFNQSFIRLFNYAINLFIISYISSNYGESILADYFISLQFILLLSTISIFGFNIASQKTIPTLINNQNIKFEIFTSGSLIISLIISIIFVLILSSMVYLKFNFLNYINSEFLLYLILCIPLFTIILFVNEILRSVKKLIIGQIITLIVLPLLLCINLLFFNSIDNKNNLLPIIFFISYLFSSIICIVVNLKLKLLTKFHIKLKFEIVKNIIKDHFVYFLNSIISLISIIGFSFILNGLNMKSEVASYNLVIILSSIIGMPLIFMNNKYLRNFTINIKNNDHRKNYNLFKKISLVSVKFGVIGIFINTLFLYFFSDQFFNFNFNDLIYSLCLSNIAFIINSYFGPNQSVLLIYGYGKILNIIAFIILFISLFLSYFLIQYFNYLGAIISFLVYQLLINTIISIFINNNIFTKRIIYED